MVEYEQDTRIVLYATFLTQLGEAATISGTPTITVRHYNAGVKTDVNAQDMTQLAGSTYYYEYHIANSADKTVYTVHYNATYSDSTAVVGNEEFYVIPRKFYSRKAGGLVQRFPKSIWSGDEKDLIVRKIGQLEEIGK